MVSPSSHRSVGGKFKRCKHGYKKIQRGTLKLLAMSTVTTNEFDSQFSNIFENMDKLVQCSITFLPGLNFSACGCVADAATPPPPWLLCNDDTVRNCRHMDYGCDGGGGGYSHSRCWERALMEENNRSLTFNSKGILFIT